MLVAALAAAIVIDRAAPESGCWSLVAKLLAAQAAFILLWRAGAAAFRADRPAPDAAPGVLVLSHRHRAHSPARRAALPGLLRRREPVHRQPAAPRGHGRRRVGPALGRAPSRRRWSGPDGKVTSSDLEWLPVGAPAPWDDRLERPGFLVDGDDVWLAVPTEKTRTVRLLHLNGPGSPWLQQLADRTGYETGVEPGTSRQEGPNITIDEKPRPSGVRVGKRKLPEPRRGGHGAAAGRADFGHGRVERPLGPRLLPRDRPQCRRGEGQRRQERRGPHGGHLAADRRRPALRAGRGRDRQRLPHRFLRDRRDRPLRLRRRAHDRVRPRRLDRPQRQSPDARHRGGGPRRLFRAGPVQVARPDRRPRPVLRRHGGLHPAPPAGHGPQGAPRERDRDRPDDPAQAAAADRGQPRGRLRARPFRAGRRDRRRLLRLRPDAGRPARLRARRRLRPRPADGAARRHGQGRPFVPRRGGARRRGAVRADERPDPSLDGPAALHDARLPCLRCRHAHGNADQRRTARPVSRLGRRPRGALAAVLSARPLSGKDVPVPRALLRGRRRARLLQRRPDRSRRREGRGLRLRTLRGRAARPRGRGRRTPCATRSSPRSPPTPAIAPPTTTGRCSSSRSADGCDRVRVQQTECTCASWLSAPSGVSSHRCSSPSPPPSSPKRPSACWSTSSRATSRSRRCGSRRSGTSPRAPRGSSPSRTTSRKRRRPPG